LTSIIGWGVYKNEGVKSRSDINVDLVSNNLMMPTRSNGYCFYDFNENTITERDEITGWSCSLGSDDKLPKTLLYGDSFAGQYEPFWDEISKKEVFSIHSITTNWCFPSLEGGFSWSKTHESYQQCIANREYVFKNISNYQNIIISAAWFSVYRKGHIQEVKDFIYFAASKDINVFIMSSPVTYDTDILKRYVDTVSFGSQFSITAMPKSNDLLTRQANNYLKSYADNFENVYFIDRKYIFTKEDMFTNNNGLKLPYSLDGAHISIDGSIYASRYFEKSVAYKNIIQIIISPDKEK
jgi:hypothetical protein